MIVLYAKGFKRMYEKLRPKTKQRFKERRNIFLERPFEPILENHALHAEYAGCRSINVTGDYRATFTTKQRTSSVSSR